jgi:formylglycine-generating enzyme required for sulfatase activity
MVGFGIWRAIHEGHRDSGPAPTVTPAAAVPPAPTATAVATPVVLPVDVADGARVSPGAFSMGSPASERGRNGDESQHLVTITRAYWLKRTEVTQQEWTDVMASNPSRFKSCGAACPVENVNWYEAVAYCNALSARQNVERCYLDGSKDYDQESAATQTTPSWPKGLDCSGYRLPTEAEWEYAARAGTKGAFFTGEIAETACQGDPNLDKAGWYCGNAQETTHPVAQKAANAWGMYDMLGNVGEWVWDFQTDVGGAAQRDPVGRLAGALRVFRGGSWGRNAGDTRAASRDSDAPRSRNGSVGFRPARTIP